MIPTEAISASVYPLRGQYRQVRSPERHTGFENREFLALMGCLTPEMDPEITMLCRPRRGESRNRWAGAHVRETSYQRPESGFRGISPGEEDNPPVCDPWRCREGMISTEAVSASVYPLRGQYRQVRSPERHTGFENRAFLARMGGLTPEMCPEITMLCRSKRGESRDMDAGGRVRETSYRQAGDAIYGITLKMTPGPGYRCRQQAPLRRRYENESIERR